MKTSLALFAFVAVIAFCGCHGSRPVSSVSPTTPGHTFTDLLEKQLETIHYRSVIIRDGGMLTLRVGTAPAKQVRRAICHVGGWPDTNRVVRLDETIRRLSQEGIARLQIVSNEETMEVQLNGQGKCVKNAQ